MKISIVIPAYNAEKTIGACVNAALRQQGDFAFEVIVVDDGSTDATKSIVKGFDSVRYLYQANSGPAAARNNGIRNASGDFIFLTDSDCVPRSDWLEKMMAAFNDEGAWVAAGSYGIANPQSLLARCVQREILYRHHHLMDEWIKVFGSYNVAFRREIFKRVGFFDEQYPAASGEDNDFSYRIVSAGYRIRFCKDALVDHYHPVSLRRYLKEQFRHGFWRARIYRCHPSQIRGDGYTFWKDIFEVQIVLMLSLTALLAFAGLFSRSVLLIFFFLFYLFETAFALIMSFPPVEVFYYGAVLMLRALMRTSGFISGVFMSLPQVLEVKKYN